MTQLNESREKKYNLESEWNNLRGTAMANIFGYAFIEPNELTYEELLQMEEQIGNVSRGLSLEEIE